MREVQVQHTSGVYLLCATGLVGGRSRHYVGGSQDVAWRVGVHKSGQGSHFTRAVKEQGYTLRLAYVWYVPLPLVWPLEQRIKSWRSHSTFCPYCNPDASKHWDAVLREVVKDATSTGVGVGQEYPLFD